MPMPRLPANVVWPATLLLLGAMAACDRSPRGAAPAARIEAGAVTTPLPARTVALSGAVRDLPAGTTPDAVGATPVAGSPTAAVRPPPPVDSSTSTPPPAGESAAMREFREAQERRDRELLDRDIDDTRGGQDGLARDDEPRDTDSRADEPLDRDARDEPLPEDIGWDSAQGDDELPPDEELPMDEDGPPIDEDVPPEDDDELRWDPATGTWR